MRVDVRKKKTNKAPMLSQDDTRMVNCVSPTDMDNNQTVVFSNMPPLEESPLPLTSLKYSESIGGQSLGTYACDISLENSPTTIGWPEEDDEMEPMRAMELLITDVAPPQTAGQMQHALHQFHSFFSYGLLA